MSSSKIRLITYNIAHGRGLSLYQGFSPPQRIERIVRKIGHLLQRHQADVAALQEVDCHSHWNQRIDLFSQLLRDGPFRHGVIGLHNRRVGRKPLHYGNAILSRWPITSWQVQDFGHKTLGEKGFVYAQLSLPDQRDLSVVNLHLDYRSRQQRLRQVDTLISHLKAWHKSGKNWTWPIICGDFNSADRRRQDAVQHLLRYLQELADYRLHPRNMRTFPSFWPRLALDFVFLPPTCRVQRCEVLTVRLSDHRPVLLEWEMED